MINAALIGISGFGSVHCNDLLREHRGRRLKFAAATVINQEQEAERCAVLRELGVELFSDYREMLEKQKEKAIKQALKLLISNGVIKETAISAA